ncbi:MAG TPA: hypothetical protein PKV21_09455 [bacterium]|nr:hypothetical protein [bacterium]
MGKKQKLGRGDIIFFYPNKFYQRIIAYFDGKYCHCGIYLGDNQIASVGFRGLTIENLDNYKNNKFDIFEIKDISTTKKEAIIKHFLGLMPIVKYDFFGVLNFIFRWFWNIPQRFYCSEAIAYSLYCNGFVLEKLELSPLELSNQDILIKK